MKILRDGVDPEAFFRSVARAPRRALLLDYDGTLAPFRRERDRAFPYPGVRERLSEIVRTGGTHVSVVSGRPLADLPALLGLPSLPELWGSHGKERRTLSGEVVSSPPDSALARLILDAGAWAEARGWGERFERKPYGFALHGRGMPEDAFQEMRREALARWTEKAARAALELLDFDGGFEFRPSGVHKGQVVETVAAEMGGEAALAYLGDDRTDEDAFREVHGRGLAVLVRPELRPTEADLWLHPPEDLLLFLDRWASAARIGGQHQPGPGGRPAGVETEFPHRP